MSAEQSSPPPVILRTSSMPVRAGSPSLSGPSAPLPSSFVISPIPPTSGGATQHPQQPLQSQQQSTRSSLRASGTGGIGAQLPYPPHSHSAHSHHSVPRMVPPPSSSHSHVHHHPHTHTHPSQPHSVVHSQSHSLAASKRSSMQLGAGTGAFPITPAPQPRTQPPRPYGGR